MSDPSHGPEVLAAVAQERAAAAQLALADQLGDIHETIAPAQRAYTASLQRRAAAWTAAAATLEALKALLDGLFAVLKGWWGGPIMALLLVLLAAIWLASSGWGPADVTTFTTESIRAARCEAPGPRPEPTKAPPD